MKVIYGDFPISVHPGEVLKVRLEELNINQAFLANHLGMDPAKINEVCRGRRGVSVQMAVILVPLSVSLLVLG